MFIVIENDTEMSETDPFYSEEADGMSKRTQLEEYFSQSLEIDLLLRLCPDDEDIIYQIVDLLVDTCAPSNIAFVHTLCTARKEKSTYIRPYKMTCHPDGLSWSQVWFPIR